MLNTLLVITQRTTRKITWLLSLSATVVVMNAPTVLAAPQNSPSEANLRSRDLIFVDQNGLVGNNACAAGSGTSVPLSTNLPESIITQVNANKTVYEEISKRKDVPWQLIAALHYREHGLDGTTNPGNGQGVFQLYSLVTSGQYNFPAGPIDTAEFIRQGEIAVDYFLSKQSATPIAANQVRITATNPSPEAIKDTFYSYNGRAYAEEAARYGFSPTTQPYEGSAYVMNKFDTARNAMRIQTKDNSGVLDGIDSRPGAYTIYAALAGIAGGAGCSGGGGASGSSIVDIAKAELDKGVVEIPDGSNCGPDVQKYTDGVCEYWCADFVSWVYKEAGKPFTEGWSGGWRVSYVPTMRAWLTTNGTFTGRSQNSFPPKPGDVVTFGGSPETDSSGDDGHVGIIWEIKDVNNTPTNPGDDTLISIEGNTSNEVGKREYENYLSNARVSGWGRMK